jgi:hypothetical protein
MTKFNPLKDIADIAEREEMAVKEAFKQYEAFQEALKLIQELEKHLYWIGWGDSYERECAYQKGDVRDQLNEFKKKYYPKENKNER